MADTNHNFEFYAGLLNYILSPRKDEQGKILGEHKQPALRILPILDADLLQSVPSFGSKAVVKILQLVKRYYNQYGAIPSEVVYQDIKNNEANFKKWYVEEATPDQRAEVDRLDLFIYQPVTDEKYYEERIVDLCIKIKLAATVQAVNLKIAQPGAQGEPALDMLYEELYAFKNTFEQVRQKRVGMSRYVYEEGKDVEEFQQVAGVASQFDLIELRPNGILGLYGAAKDGKTRIVIALARYWAARGYDVMYLDTENGEVNMDMRFLQAELTEWKGYPVDSVYFYAGQFIHEDRIPIDQYDPTTTHTVQRGDELFKVVSWTELEEQEDGTEREQTYVQARVYEALVPSPTLDPEEDEDGAEWSYVGVYEDELDTPPEDRVYEDFQTVLDTCLEEVIPQTKGQVRIEYIPSPHMNEVENAITRVIQDPTTDFFSRPKFRILIVDWMQLVQNSGKIWERTRANYDRLKTLQGRLQMYVMVIDGVKDKTQLQKLYPDLAKAGTLGTDMSDFNVAASVLFCVSEEERNSGTARIVAKRTRYGASGTHVQEFLEIDPKYSTIYKIDREDHEAKNPELWNETPEKSTKKKDKQDTSMFDGLTLS